ncbi:hypothetical protein, partial [Microcella sp.]|uniref:hypothetical protein n=1 Tax=Microcella sp. TaxID=1913979 RepID=UPI00299F7355
MVSPHLAGQTGLAVGPVTLKLGDDVLDHLGRLVLAELGAGIDARHSHPNADRASGYTSRVLRVEVQASRLGDVLLEVISQVR